MLRVTGPTTVDIGGGKLGFVDENLGAGIEGTDVSAAWLNGVQEEILNIIETAGLSPAAGNQLLGAISAMFGGSGTLATPGRWRFPGGLEIKWGTLTGVTGALSPDGVAENASVGVTFAQPFPSAGIGAVATAHDVSGASLQEHVWLSGPVSTTGFSAGVSCRQAGATVSAFWIALGL